MDFSEYQLSFERDMWVLSTSKFNPNFTLELRIKFAFHGNNPFYSQTAADWCEYQFFACFDGSEVRIVTNEEWREHVEYLRGNVGDAEMKRWVQSSVWTCPDIDSTYADTLREFGVMLRRWESMLQLGLFTPTVTLTPFGS